MCCRVAVLNDFEANGYGILALQPDEVVVLHDAPPTPKVCSCSTASHELVTAPLLPSKQHGTCPRVLHSMLTALAAALG